MWNFVLGSLAVLALLCIVLALLWRRDEKVGQTREAKERHRSQLNEERKRAQEKATLTVLAREHTHQPQA